MSEQERVRRAVSESEETINDPLPDEAPATRPNRTVPVSVRLSPGMVAEIE